MKAIHCSIVWILVASIFVQACDSESTQERTARDQKTREQEQIAQDKAERKAIIDAVKEAQNADDTWDQGLRLSTWTVDLKERIVGKPIVSSGM